MTYEWKTNCLRQPFCVRQDLGFLDLLLREIRRRQCDPDIPTHDLAKRPENINVKPSRCPIFEVGNGRIVLIAQGANRLTSRMTAPGRKRTLALDDALEIAEQAEV
jgi:hypothetical protein